jgi:hypothetical protein
MRNFIPSPNLTAIAFSYGAKAIGAWRMRSRGCDKKGRVQDQRQNSQCERSHHSRFPSGKLLPEPANCSQVLEPICNGLAHSTQPCDEVGPPSSACSMDISPCPAASARETRPWGENQLEHAQDIKTHLQKDLNFDFLDASVIDFGEVITI